MKLLKLAITPISAFFMMFILMFILLNLNHSSITLQNSQYNTIVSAKTITGTLPITTYVYLPIVFDNYSPSSTATPIISPTSTSIPTLTNTPTVTPSLTNTPTSPTDTPIPTGTINTPTPTPAGPTDTPTPGGPTDTPTPISPTDTPTPTSPTNTPTPTGPTNTPTSTPVGQTHTPTPTPVGQTNTPTPTPGGPTDTPTPAGPTDTPTPGGTIHTPTPTPISGVDLVITSIIYDDNTQEAVITILNQGSVTAPSWFFVDLYVDRIPTGISDLGDYYATASTGLGPGASENVTITNVTLSAGNHQLYAQADTYNGANGDPTYGNVQESNEDNNISGPIIVP